MVESTRASWLGETSIEIPGSNHHTICTYSNSFDSGFIQIIHQLQYIRGKLLPPVPSSSQSHVRPGSDNPFPDSASSKAAIYAQGALSNQTDFGPRAEKQQRMSDDGLFPYHSDFENAESTTPEQVLSKTPCGALKGRNAGETMLVTLEGTSSSVMSMISSFPEPIVYEDARSFFSGCSKLGSRDIRGWSGNVQIMLEPPGHWPSHDYGAARRERERQRVTINSPIVLPPESVQLPDPDNDATVSAWKQQSVLSIGTYGRGFITSYADRFARRDWCARLYRAIDSQKTRRSDTEDGAERRHLE